MYNKQFEQILNEVEVEFSQLWEILCQFKGGIDDNRFQEIFDFQYRLGRQLRKIQVSYNSICDKERKVIGRKKILSTYWFKRSLQSLSAKREVLKSLNYVGRSLGDAFAYFFYQFDLEHLDNHLKNEEISSFPTSIGGLGELEFIRNCKLIKDNITVYHGITNILRVGDVSLFNTKTLKLTGIGELKTKRKNEKDLTISLILIGKRKHDLFTEVKVKEGNIENLADGMYDKERVTRQIVMMKNHFPKDSRKTNPFLLHDTYHFADIEQLFKNSKRHKINFKKVSDGLIYICVRDQRKFTKRFSFASAAFKKNIEEFNEALKEIVIPGYRFNHLSYGSILYGTHNKPQICLGVPPLFWSFLGVDCLRALYFHECAIVTMFNPAHIFRRLEEKGFTVETENNVIELTRSSKKNVVKIPGMTLKFFFDQVANHGQTEDAVTDLICNFYDKIKNKRLSTTTKIELKMTHLYRRSQARKASR